MDSWELAGQAIEQMVASEHPESSINWSAIIPMSDTESWGLGLQEWAREAGARSNGIRG